jgi:hypothetical protein
VPQHINQTEPVSLAATKTDPQLYATGPDPHNVMTQILLKQTDLTLQHVSESDKLNWTHNDYGNHKMTLFC